MSAVAKSQVFDGAALAKFSGLALITCILFDMAYAFLFPMVTAWPLETIALICVTYKFGWWGNAYRYSMKIAALALSIVLPNIALGLLATGLMILQVMEGPQ